MRRPDAANLPYLLGLTATLVLIWVGDVSLLDTFATLEPSSVMVGSPTGAFVSGTSGQRFDMKRIRTHGGITSRTADTIQEIGEGNSTRCKTWAIITTINPPTRTIKQLAALADLCVCIVGDKKTPSDFQLPGVTYLSPDMQENLPYGMIRLLPWNHFGRKNIGYLYAIQHGAQAIYDTDDDNQLLDGLNSLPFTTGVDASSVKRVHLDSSAEKPAVNLYPLFGSPMSWPRGFPLDQIRESVSDPLGTKEASSDDTSAIAIIQSLANHDPDVDAIYRMSTLPLPFDFRAGEPGLVALPPLTKVMPFNAQATMHFHHAFWGMLLPTTVHGRVSDIWRSYFTQRLLWETNGMVAFASPWVVQYRNAHNYLTDFQAELHLYERSSALVRYLFRQWQCDSDDLDIAQCMVQLYTDMYEHGILEALDVELVVQWIADLRAVGYAFPRRIKRAAASRIRIFDIMDDYHAEPSQDGQGIKVVPGASVPPAAANAEAFAEFYEDPKWSRRSDVVAQPVIMGNPSLEIRLQNFTLGSARYLSVRYVDRQGSWVVLRFKEPLIPVPVFEDILLVINFNHDSDYYLMKDMVDIHGQAFPNLIGIGTDPLDPSIVTPLPFHVVPEVRNGWGMPIALTYAMKHYPGYRGYLLTNNDVATRFWKWAQFDRDRIWFDQCTELGPKLGDPNDEAWNRWWWFWEKETNFLRTFISSLKDVQQPPVLIDSNGDHHLSSCGSDLFYVPSRHTDNFSRYVDQLSDLWNKTNLFEAAMPTILRALDPDTEWQPAKSYYCQASAVRDTHCPEFFLSNEFVEYVHPWKIGLAGQQHPFLALKQKGKMVYLRVA